MTPSRVPLALCVAVTTGCIAMPEPTDEAAQDLHGTWLTSAPTKIADTTLLAGGCMATRISATFAITSRGCNVHVGDLVTFHLVGLPQVPTGRVEEVIGRPGTTASGCWNRETCLDSSNLFGDLALIRLSAEVPASVNETDALSNGVATMAWRYPGEDAVGYEVGPEIVGSGFLDVVALTDSLDSPSDANGWFETINDNSDLVDRGGGFWVNNRVVGTLWGGGYDVLDGNWQLYASVPRFLDWILVKIQYAWRGTPVANNQVFDGNAYEQFGGTERVCQYACEHSPTCEAYNFTVSPQTCQLVTAVSGRHTQSGRHSALHFGASTGKSGDVVGYNRSDGWTSVLHKTESGALHEFYRNASQWFVGGLPTLAGEPPAANARISAYRRADGFNVVLYRSTHGKIVEVALGGSGWAAADLGGSPAGGDPIGFVTGDGFSAVVYRGTDDFLHELHLGTNGWFSISPAAKALAPGGNLVSDPVPFVDAQGATNIVYRNTDNHLVRVFTHGTHAQWWAAEDVTAIGNAPLAAGRPYGYTRRNGTTAIVYRTNTQKLVELRKTTTGWIPEDLTPTGMSMIHDPVAYVRTDGVDSIVYRGYDGHLRETTRSPLQHWDLSAQYSIPGLLNDPSVYIRSDVTNSILYPLNWLHAGELSFSAGDTGWSRTDLTTVTGEQL